MNKEKCPTLFSNIVQPPPKIKNAWRGMIPKWAWDAMVNDTGMALKKELPRKTSSADLERIIRNKYVFIRREAFLPESFLPDIVDEACKKVIN